MNIDRLQKLKDKKAAIDAQIRDLAARERHQQRKDDTRRKIIIGALALEHLEKNKESAFARTLLPLLDEYVGRSQDRQLLNAHFETVGLPQLPINDSRDDHQSLKNKFPNATA